MNVWLYFLVPRPPRSAVAGDYWIRVRPSVCPSVCQLFRWVSIPRPNSKNTGQNRIKLCTMKGYTGILKLCTWVLIFSCDQNWGRTTWPKMRKCFVISQGTRSCDLKCRCTDWDGGGLSDSLTLLVFLVYHVTLSPHPLRLYPVNKRLVSNKTIKVLVRFWTWSEIWKKKSSVHPYTKKSYPLFFENEIYIIPYNSYPFPLTLVSFREVIVHSTVFYIFKNYQLTML